MYEVRIVQADARPGCAGYVVQLRTLAVFDAGLACRYGGFSQVLSDELADHRIRHPFFLGGADDHDGVALHAQSTFPRGVLALAGAHGERREDVEVQGHGTRPGGAESAIRDRCDAILPGVYGRALDGHWTVVRPAGERAEFRE